MNYSLGQKPKKKTSKRFVFSMTVLCFCLMFAGAAFVYYDLSRDDATSRSQSTNDQPVQIVAGKQTFKTDYFMFEAGADWKLLEQFSAEGKRYRFSKIVNSLPKAHLQVIINDTSEREIEHVVAVQRTGKRLSILNSTSNHCSGQEETAITTGKKVITLNGVRFLCNVDGNSYTVAAGLVDGGIRIPFENENGDVTTYTFIYEDVQFSPDAAEFEQILKSLEIL